MKYKRNNKKRKNSKLNLMLNDFKYYSLSGKVYQAQEALNALKKVYPNNHKVKFEEALFLRKYGSRDDMLMTLEILNELIEQNSYNKNACMYEYIKTSIYLSLMSDKILNYLDILKRENYKVNQIEYYYGKFYEKNNNYEEALNHYKLSEELGYEKASVAVTKMEIKQDPSTRKSENITSINENDNMTIDKVYIKCKVLLTERKMSELYDLLKKSEKLIKTDYLNKYNLYFIFNYYLDISKFDDAQALYLKYCDYLQNDYEKKYYEARIDLCNGEYDLAEKKLIYVINCNSDYTVDSYKYLAKIAYANNDLKLEQKCYEDMINLKNYEMGKLYIIEFYIRNNNYEKAIQYFNSINFDEINSNYSNIRQLSAMLGLEITDQDREYYTIKQIENYDINLAIEHINRHKNIIDGVGYFNEDVNIEELLLDVTAKIKNKRANYNDTLSHYILKYPNVGKYDNISIDYVEVVSIPNTNNVITMYPVASDNIFATNYYKEKVKVKTLNRKSQMEKFYERYGIK